MNDFDSEDDLDAEVEEVASSAPPLPARPAAAAPAGLGSMGLAPRPAPAGSAGGVGGADQGDAKGGASDAAVGGGWAGLATMPTATQASLLAQVKRLQEAGKEGMTVLLVGKGGMGRSALCNSLLGERVVHASPFGRAAGGINDGPRSYSRSAGGFSLTVVDTPGVVEGDAVDEGAMASLSEFVGDLDGGVDVVVYVDRLDTYRCDARDRECCQAITRAFGKGVWQRTVVALTRGQYTVPLEDVSYAEFLERRSESLKACIRAAGAPKGAALPCVPCENGSRCATNEGGEKVTPNGDVWLSTLVEALASASIAAGASMKHDAERMARSCDRRGRLWMLPLLALQAVVVLPLARQACMWDNRREARERTPRRAVTTLPKAVSEAQAVGDDTDSIDLLGDGISYSADDAQDDLGSAAYEDNDDDEDDEDDEDDDFEA